MISIKESPIFYMGSKRKLLKRGLLYFFKNQNIKNFCEPFSGSAIVSMNIDANTYWLSDTNSHLIEIYNFLHDNKAEDIIQGIHANVEKYGLAKERTKRNVFDNVELIEKYKKAFSDLRDVYNNTFQTIDFITLMYYSFSQQFRFNSEGLYNMPCGNDYFSKTNELYIKNGCSFFQKDSVRFEKKSFSDILFSDLDKNTFVYLDPPYLTTTATYNELNSWTDKDEECLYKGIETLLSKGIPFALSNVFSSKGKDSLKLKTFCEEHNLKVHHVNMVYSACGKGNAQADEVLITDTDVPIDKIAKSVWRYT